MVGDAVTYADYGWFIMGTVIFKTQISTLRNLKPEKRVQFYFHSNIYHYTVCKAEILCELEMEDLILENAPKLHSLVDRVRQIPETAKYIENFKDTKTIVHSLFKQ